MFDHTNFELYPFESMPLNRDVFLIGQRWLKEYESQWLGVFGGATHEPVGLIGYAAVRSVKEDAAQLSWYANISTRFHEVAVALPRSEFICCVDVRGWDEKPHIFVTDRWLSELYQKTNSAFALIDAIGVKAALERGYLTHDRLVGLRQSIDEFASTVPEAAFISFADSLLVKTSWRVGSVEEPARPPIEYRPELFVKIVDRLRKIFVARLGLDVYAVLTQGLNEFYADEVIHIAASRNHVSLNSLGLPFAQLLAIDERVRYCIKHGVHYPGELYMDEPFFHSLRLRHYINKDTFAFGQYRHPMAAEGEWSKYYIASRHQILVNLDEEADQRNANIESPKGATQ